jgi:DNA-binding phage protein
MLSDVLQDAIRNSGQTHYRIAKNAGVGPETIDRFMAGRDIRISTAAKIAEALGLELKPKENK